MRHLPQLLKAWCGDADAQFQLALQSWFGESAARNARRAIYWAQRAQKNGHPDALMLTFSIVHESGHEKEALEGIVLAWQSAANHGDPGAQFALGHCYERGDFGLPKDDEKALYWYTQGAIGGYPDAQSAVARLCAKG